MICVYKYPLSLGRNEIVMPYGAEFALFGIDIKFGTLAIWFQVNTDRAKYTAVVHVFPTGAPVAGSHLGSCICDDGTVWHAYGEGFGSDRP